MLVLRPTIFDRHVWSLNIADFRETAPDGVHTANISFARSYRKESYHGHHGLLRTHRERPRKPRAANHCDELAPLHCQSRPDALNLTVGNFQRRSMRSNVRRGSKAALTAPKSNFRFTPESGLRSDIAPCPKSANRRLMHRNN